MAIRPLLQFYGMMALAKAVVVGRCGVNLATLPQSHGISDVSEPCRRIGDLRVRLEERGMFQRFNDVVGDLVGLRYYRGGVAPSVLPLPATSSSQLVGVSLTISDLLARIPHLDRLYEQTFHSPALSTIAAIMEIHDHWELRFDSPGHVFDFDALVDLIGKWRERFPFAKKWAFDRADLVSYGGTAITFINTDPADDELEPARFYRSEHGFEKLRTIRIDAVAEAAQRVWRPVAEILPPLGGSFESGYPTAIAPLSNGSFLSDSALHYLALFLLSSLVRYRPNIWVHAISRSVAEDMPADDDALALIETFLELNAVEVPRTVAAVLGPDASIFRTQDATPP